MKTIGRRSIVLYFAIILLIGGFALLLIRLAKNGEDWVIQTYNGHLYANSSNTEIGDISDRNGVVLAFSEDGTRNYSSNILIRQATLHTVGDKKAYIPTSVQSNNMASLVGYNIFTGLNATPLKEFGSNDIKLTIDANLCGEVYELLEGKKAAVVLYNYKTGDVICKVSTPSYDPLNVPSDINDNPAYAGAYIDNTISSSYTPGSIFKIITAACAIENIEDWENLTFNCDKTLKVGGSTVTCLGKHGDLTLEEALGHSCNVYFAKLALELGTEKLQKTAEDLGFNQNFKFDDFTTAKSSVNLENASDIDLAWSAVGQFTNTANPMNMLVLMSAIANGGDATNPKLIDDNSAVQSTQLMSKTTANELDKLLRNVVVNYYGDNSFNGYSICGKTGTAEVGGDKKPTSWFVGYTKDAPYAFSVAVEEGGSGSGIAKSIVQKMLDYLLKYS